MNPEAYQINADHRRMEREQIFKETVDRINPIRWAQMTPQQQSDWIAYRQALLDISKQPGFPFNVQWPNKPE